jgi:hypothetical protein
MEEDDNDKRNRIFLSRMYWTDVADSFSQGRIAIDGSFLKSEACYEATGTCHGNLNLLASGTTVIPIVTDAAGHSGFDELTLTQTSSRNKCGESALL